MSHNQDICDGTTKGYYQITFGKGASVELADAIPKGVQAKVQESVDDIADGSIKVELDQSETE